MPYFLRRYDFVLFGAIFGLCVLSLIALYSIDLVFFWRQVVWVLLAFGVLLFGNFIHFSWFRAQAWFRYGFYGLSVFLLLLTHLQNVSVRGTRGWLHIGSFQFEPVELAKVALVILLAHFFSRRYVEAWFSRNLLTSLFFVAVPALIVLLHPDFGSAVVLLALWVCFLLFSGIHFKRFLIGFGLFIVLCAVLWFSILKPYQKNRILGFFQPTYDPLGVNYNVIQSKIAIGSAGFFGKGFGLGTQTQLHFLPEAHSDFIFAAFVEEWGLFGALVLLFLYLLMLYRIILAGIRANGNEVKFLSLGAAVVFFVQFFINVGSNLAILPVTGLTLPFFSYGGSSLLTSALLIAIIQNTNVDSSRL